MAKEGRDEKGRFIPGVVPAGSTPFSAGVAKEMQKKSAEARKDNRIVTTALRDALLSKDPESGDPTIVAIVRSVTGRLTKDGRAADLHVIADTLGELQQKVHVDGDIEITCKFGDE